MNAETKAPAKRTKSKAARAPTTPGQVKRPKNILLFSDGTGNSSGKLQKTNVWRLYEALDLGYPVPTDGCIQVAYYDNGVGTSTFKPFAALGGIFGFGLARNIRNIYKFLCRNYEPGDRIYAFGFSRGAYTIRLLVALVCAMGVAMRTDAAGTPLLGTGGKPVRLGEGELDLAAHDVWAQARRAFHTNNLATDFLVSINRGFTRALIRLKRRVLRQPSNYRFRSDPKLGWFAEWYAFWFESDARHEARKGAEAASDAIPGLVQTDIEFVGVWDTVAAYGGPFVELTRAIDEWIWPLTMPHYQLSPRVRMARHALAIDDKRDAFQPLLWDEVGELPPPEGQLPRLQQVWFAGMHADVGGGYADESLSYVSLWWMIEHAKSAGMRLIGEYEKRIDAVRNVYGPLHDSRGGVGAFYRYQPRYINAWVDHDPARVWQTSYPQGTATAHVQPATQIFRDPTVDRARYRDRGYLVGPARLHWSVEQRLQMATDGYGPNNLPSRYVVDLGVHGTRLPAVLPFSSGAEVAHEAELYLADRIKLRRFWYFTTIVLVVILALRPVWPKLWGLKQLGGTIDDRTNAQPLEALVNTVLPGFLADWTHALFADLFTSLAVIGLIGATMALGLTHERMMVDISRQLWTARFTGQPPQLEPLNWIERFSHALARFVHKSNKVQAILAFVKWRVVPVALGAALWMTLFYAVITAGVQIWLARVESRPSTCLPASAATELVPGEARKWKNMHISVPCKPLGVLLRPNQAYRIEIELQPADDGFKPWTDGEGEPGHPAQTASPQGWIDPDLSGRARELGATFAKRVVTAPLMAPIIELRRPAVDARDGPNPWWFCKRGSTAPVCDKREWRRVIFGDTIYMIHPRLRQVSREAAPHLWEATIITPPASSRVYRDLPKPVPTGMNPEEYKAGELFVFVNDAVVPFDSAGRTKNCPRIGNKLRVLDLCGRYANNHGTYTLRLWALDGTALERTIDLRGRRRCYQFADRDQCNKSFDKPPPR